jgi:hypothetical protein
MFYFLRLLLAHFIGDFPLQFNFIFRSKLKGFHGTIPHALIIFACMVALSWPYLGLPQVWAFLVFIAATHLVQDSLKVKFGGKNAFFSYILDQLMHAALIACLFPVGLGQLPPPAGNSPLIQGYNNNGLVVLLIALIAATYNGYFMIRCFKDTYLGRAHYSGFEKWYGIAERGAIVLAFFLRPVPLYVTLPLIVLLRPLFYRLLSRRCGVEKDFLCLDEALMSWAVALLTVLAVVYFNPRTL